MVYCLEIKQKELLKQFLEKFRNLNLLLPDTKDKHAFQKIIEKINVDKKMLPELSLIEKDDQLDPNNHFFIILIKMEI